MVINAPFPHFLTENNSVEETESPQNVVLVFLSEVIYSVEGYLNPKLFNPQLQPRTFNHDFFNTRLFNYESFNSGYFSIELFNYDLFNHELFNHELFHLELVSKSKLDTNSSSTLKS